MGRFVGVAILALLAIAVSSGCGEDKPTGSSDSTAPTEDRRSEVRSQRRRVSRARQEVLSIERRLEDDSTNTGTGDAAASSVGGTVRASETRTRDIHDAGTIW